MASDNFSLKYHLNICYLTVQVRKYVIACNCMLLMQSVVFCSGAAFSIIYKQFNRDYVQYGNAMSRVQNKWNFVVTLLF